MELLLCVYLLVEIMEKIKRFNKNNNYFKWYNKNKKLIKNCKVIIKNNIIYIYYKMIYN